MFKVRVSSTSNCMKQDYIDYIEREDRKVLTRFGGVIIQVIDGLDTILFMTKYVYSNWCKGKTYYDDIDKCYKHSGYKVSREKAEQYEREEIKRNLHKPVDIYENLC